MAQASELESWFVKELWNITPASILTHCSGRDAILLLHMDWFSGSLVDQEFFGFLN